MTTIESRINEFLTPGTWPYIHSNQVKKLLQNVTDDKDIILAGYLHDVIEDSDITLIELTQYVGSRVASLVWEVTKTGSNEFKNLKTKEGIMIKFADRLSNISNLPFKQYKEIGIQPYLDKSVFWRKE